MTQAFQEHTFSFGKRIEVPQIPTNYLGSAVVVKMLCAVLRRFSFEEQTVIYLYVVKGMGPQEIARQTELCYDNVLNTLFLSANRFNENINSVKQMNIATYDKRNLVHLRYFFEIELVKSMMARDFLKYYLEWQQKNAALCV